VARCGASAERQHPRRMTRRATFVHLLTSLATRDIFIHFHAITLSSGDSSTRTDGQLAACQEQRRLFSQ